MTTVVANAVQCPHHGVDLVLDIDAYRTGKVETHACPETDCAWTVLLPRTNSTIAHPTRRVWNQLGHRDAPWCTPCGKRAFPDATTARLQLLRAQLVHTAENRPKIEARAYECPRTPGTFHLTHHETYGGKP